MKKTYNFKIEKNSYLLQNVKNPNEQFLIDIDDLQFDSKNYYDAVFENVNEHVQIDIEKDESLSSITNSATQKSANIVYNTIFSITNQICKKLNEEYFDIEPKSEE